ncbi:unnamed protein product [Caenorhabditis bovis]|uniref:Uncharacterized protein n=1 Tax=Caenorhabditis bovis TaxID=2654633 RepID=A0A8S1EX40_9PELO|nr:unnamed protein product [Caenorhabditis bovis]
MKPRVSTSSETNSSGFGSMENLEVEEISAPRGTKRKTLNSINDLDELMKNSLNVTEKRTCYDLESKSLSITTQEDHRLSTRRASSMSRCSPVSLERRASMKSPRGNCLQFVRNFEAISTDSISPRSINQYRSPRKRINLSPEDVYSKHRLGSTFSPVVVRARRRSAIRPDLKRCNVPIESSRDQFKKVLTPKHGIRQKLATLNRSRPSLNSRLLNINTDVTESSCN